MKFKIHTKNNGTLELNFNKTYPITSSLLLPTAKVERFFFQNLLIPSDYPSDLKSHNNQVIKWKSPCDFSQINWYENQLKMEFELLVWFIPIILFIQNAQAFLPSVESKIYYFEKLPQI